MSYNLLKGKKGLRKSSGATGRKIASVNNFKNLPFNSVHVRYFSIIFPGNILYSTGLPRLLAIPKAIQEPAQIPI